MQALNVGGTLTDSFNYTVSDGSLDDTAVLTITINGANDAPVGVDDAGSATEAGGTNNGSVGSDATGNVLGNDTDVDTAAASRVVAAVRTGATEGAGTAGTLGSSLTGAHGSLTLNADGSYTYLVNESDPAVQALNVGGTLTYSFNYTVSDGSLDDTAVLTITINGANDAPVGVDDAGSATEAGGTNNGSVGSDATGNVLGNDTDVDTAAASRVVAAVRTGATEGAGTAGTLGSSLTGAHGSLTLNADGSYTYLVNESDPAVQALNVGGTLTDSFNYTVSDGSLDDTAVLTITINGANDAPVGVDDAGSATEAGGTNNGSVGSDATGNSVLGNDTDVDTAAASRVVAAVRTGATEGAGTAGTLGSSLTGAHGSLTLNADGSYTYLVNESDPAVQALNVGGTLTDSFNYTVSDGSLDDTAVLTITINGANDAPVNAVPGTQEVTQTTSADTNGANVSFDLRR